MITSERLTRWLMATRWPLLLVAGILALLSWQPANRVEFDRSIENMFAPDDPLLSTYQELKRQFGANDIVMAVYVDPGLLNTDGSGISRLAAVHAELHSIEGVQDILSLISVNQALEDALEYIQPLRRFLSPDEPPIIVQPTSKLAEAYRQMFEGYTHDAKGRIATLVCMLEPEWEAKVTRRITIDQIRAVIQRQPQGKIAGEPVMVIDGFRYVELDGKRLGWATTTLLALTIVICFRSLRWVVIPLLVVRLALLLTRAVLVWADLRLSMVSSMLTAIVTVVGVATVVHIIVRFRQARAQGLNQRVALIDTGTILVVPIFWACTTDAVGFLSLTVAKVGPVQDFGVMTAVSCGSVLLSVLLLVPGLALWGRFDTDPQRVWGDGILGYELERWVQSAERRTRRWLVFLTLLFLVSLAGLFRLDVETDFTKNFRRDSPVVISYAFIEEHMGGAGVWDILVPAPATLDNAFVERVRTLEQELRSVTIRDKNGNTAPGLTKVLSLVDGIDAAAINPILKRVPPEIRARLMATAMPHFVNALRTNHKQPGAKNYLRIMLRAREQQPANQKSQLIADVREIAARHFPPVKETDGAEVTGYYVLLTNLITSILRDQWTCFGAATLGVGLMMLLAFRSPSLALIALVPNVLPIVVVLGTMGWLGVRVNMGAAMIAAVSMGLSVDSSIHYITSFRRARMAGKGVTEALTEVQQTVGRAVVYSTVALVIGFLALCTSNFIPTIYFGCLVGLAMAGGLFGNLIVLPLLLNVAMKD